MFLVAVYKCDSCLFICSSFSLFGVLYCFQLVQPAYHLMLERIQAGAIDNFKKALCHALAEGQGFAVAARDCTNKFLKIFDGQLEGI